MGVKLPLYGWGNPETWDCCKACSGSPFPGGHWGAELRFTMLHFLGGILEAWARPDQELLARLGKEHQPAQG